VQLLSSELMSQPGLRRCLFILGTACLVVGTSVRAEDLDEGKSAKRLFADSCVTCHRSARGLAKGRFRPTLFLFLQDHYSTSSGMAWELASYLASVDVPQSRPRAAAKKPSRPTTTRSSLRPPAPVPASARSN